MPSCDGGNCGACNCNCSTTKVVVDHAKTDALLKKIEQLEKELEELKEAKEGENGNG